MCETVFQWTPPTPLPQTPIHASQPASHGPVSSCRSCSCSMHHHHLHWWLRQKEGRTNKRWMHIRHTIPVTMSIGVIKYFLIYVVARNRSSNQSLHSANWRRACGWLVVRGGGGERPFVRDRGSWYKSLSCELRFKCLKIVSFSLLNGQLKRPFSDAPAVDMLSFKVCVQQNVVANGYCCLFLAALSTSSSLIELNNSINWFSQ